MTMKKTKGLAAGVMLALVASFGLGAYVGISGSLSEPVEAQSLPVITNVSSIPESSSGDRPTEAQIAQFWRAWDLLSDNFVKTNASGTMPTTEERMWAAIGGLAESYGDPYTVFFPPEEAQEFQQEISGSFSGVGMELGSRDGALTVVAPLKNTPAERAGMQSGDVIISIDGVPSRTMAVEEAVKRIRGKVGTTVELMVERAGKTFEVSITRAEISVPIIETSRKGDVFVISLYSFSGNSPNLFRGALREFFESGSTKLVLDLRGNPGGYLEAAVDMASFFLPVGDPVVTEDYDGKDVNLVHRSYGYNVFANKKLSMVVLVNGGSASASEILAGALQQHGVAKLIGSKTFGKGSVQQLMELGGGAELKVTIARWLTPNGTSISDGGLTPDIVVDRTPAQVAEGKDPQMDSALSWLATQ